MSDTEHTGFRDVDRNPDPTTLVAAMEAADAYPAVVTLRAWAEDRLSLRAGTAVIDVGCGPGTAALALANHVGDSGRVLGIDVSQVMVDFANKRASGLPTVEFAVGDASALEVADDSFDAYRSERTYQWLADPDQALREARRVVRPGGRIAIIDTGWSTLLIDHPDRELQARLQGSFPSVSPNPGSGGRLLNQMRRAGIVDIDVTAGVLLATAWDPEGTRGVPGVVPFDLYAGTMTTDGVLSPADGERWLATLRDEASAGRFFLSVTMFAYAGTSP